MHSKLPALVLWCAAFGLIAPCQSEADDKKKPAAETKKSEPAKKPERKPAKPRRKPSSEEAARAEIKKLRDSLHMAQKELAAKAQAIKALESKNSAHENALKKSNGELKKANDALKNATLNYGKASDELRKSVEAQKKTGEDLKRTTEAQQKTGDELKKTAEALAKANEDLKKFRAIDFNKLVHSLDSERKKTAALQKQLKETGERARQDLAKANARYAAATQKKPEPKKPEPKKPEPKKPAPKKTAQNQSKSPAVAPIQYDLNSAVNLKERDRVLNQLRAVFKRTPKAQIQITGYADDTPYKEANDEVGANRAGYLTKYLILKGLPKDQISCRGIGSSKQGRGNGNRKAVIQIRN